MNTQVSNVDLGKQLPSVGLNLFNEGVEWMSLTIPFSPDIIWLYEF